jgi:hypothetical protein
MEIPRYWRLRKQRYNLTGEVCPECEGKIIPPRDKCPESGCGKNLGSFNKDTSLDKVRKLGETSQSKVRGAEEYWESFLTGVVIAQQTSGVSPSALLEIILGRGEKVMDRERFVQGVLAVQKRLGE